MWKNLLCIGAVGAGALWMARQAVRRSCWFEYADKSVIVTGGSRGLGLVLARELVAAGARVSICARTEADIRVAVEELQTRGSHVFGAVCDVRDQDAVQSFVDRTIAEHGGVDVLFNVAGVMKVGPLDEMTKQDFLEAMEINCWGPLHTMLAVLPVMRRNEWGRIVNIASIGGNPVVGAIRLAPKLTGEILPMVNRVLPQPGGIGQSSAYGYDSYSAVSPSILTSLGDAAAIRNNELRPRA